MRLIASGDGKDPNILASLASSEIASVLEVIQQDGPLGVTEIARALSVPSNEVVTIVRALMREGLVTEEFAGEPAERR